MNKTQQKEYSEFMNKQFEILKGHFERCMLRCLNKMMELGKDERREGK